MKRLIGDFILWLAFRQPRYARSDLARSIDREYIIPCGPLAIGQVCSCTLASGEHTCGLVSGVRHG